MNLYKHAVKTGDISHVSVSGSGLVICRSQIYLCYNILDSIETFCFTKGINRLQGEIDSGGWEVSYLLSMAGERPKDFFTNEPTRLLVDGKEMTLKEFQKLSCYMDCKFYSLFSGRKSVRKLIEEGLRKTGDKRSFAEVKDFFELSDHRIDCQVAHCGNERIRMMAAVGDAYGKQVFCFPWMSKSYFDGFHLYMPYTLDKLEKLNKIVILPIGKE